MNTSNKKDKNQQIKVFVRVRPLNKQEKESGSHNIVDVPNNKEIVVKQHMQDKYTKKFTFDKAFGPKSQQVDVFLSVVNPLIEEVLAGYNCTVFAYGQTGTGKTYTMEGGSIMENSVSWQHDPDAGIIPRSLSNLFDVLRVQQVEYTVRVSYLELYNEEIFDLLSSPDDSSKLRLYEDSTKKGSVIVHGLEEITVHNKTEVYKILENGAEKRKTAATLMNAQSSRSHTIFSITVHIKENGPDGEELLKTGKLNLVDLAGSENIGRSGAIEKRAREAGNINQSLLTLGRVITALTERAPHIPYRESKLTRLLQESLGGRTKTSIIATISPALCNVEETLSTLDYAHRARNITNRPEVNQRFTKIALLKQYTEEIERLKRDLYAARTCNGVYIASEHYDKMIGDLENQAHEIIDKINEIQILKAELEKQKDICQQLNMSLIETNIILEGEIKKLNETKNMLQKSEQAHNEQQFLVKSHYETEQKLSQQAKTLLGVAEVSTRDLSKLHDTLTKRKTIEGENRSTIAAFQQAFKKRINDIKNQIQAYSNDQTKFNNAAIEKLLVTTNQNYNELTSMHQCVLNFVNCQTHLNDSIKKNSEKQVFVNKESSKTCNDAVEITLNEDFQAHKEFFKEYLLPNLEMCKQKSDKQISEHNKSISVLKDFFEQRLIVDNNFISSLTTTFNNLQSLVCTILEEQQSKYIELQKLIDKKQENRLKLLQIIQKCTEDDSNIDNNITQLFTSSQSHINHNLEAMQNMMNTDIKNTNQYQMELDKLKMTSDTITVECSKIVEEDVQNIKTYDDIIESIEENLKNKETHKEDNLKLIYSNITNYQNEIQTTIDNSSDILSASLAALMSLKNDENKAMMQTKSSINASQEFVQQSFVKCSQDNLKFSENISKEVHLHDEELEKLFKEQIVFYQPTGETPVRKEHKYPKYLAATSPHERLLEKFRSQKITNLFNEKKDIEYPDEFEIVNSCNKSRQLVKSVSVDDIINYNCKESNDTNEYFEDCTDKENVMQTTNLKRSITDLRTVFTNKLQYPKKERKILGEQNVL